MKISHKDAAEIYSGVSGKFNIYRKEGSFEESGKFSELIYFGKRGGSRSCYVLQIKGTETVMKFSLICNKLTASELDNVFD